MKPARRAGPLTGSGTGVLATGVAAAASAYPLGSAPLLVTGLAAVTLVAVGVLLSLRPPPTTPVTLDLPGDALAERDAAAVSVRTSGRSGRWLLSLPDVLGGPRALSGATTCRLTDLPRGAFPIGPVLARIGDPFGLAERRVEVGVSGELLVRPRLELVADRPETRRAQDAPEQPRRSRRAPTGTDPVGSHLYQPGEDLRRVLWRHYARTGQLHVQDDEQGLDDRVVVVCDTRVGPVAPASSAEGPLDVGVRVAASVADHFARRGWEVDVRAGNQRVRGHGPATGAPVLDAMARVTAGGPPLAELCQDLLSGAQRGHVVVVSAGLQPQDVRVVQRLLGRGLSVLVVALLWDPDAVGGSAAAAAAGARVVPLRPGQDVGPAVRRAVLFGSGLLGAVR